MKGISLFASGGIGDLALRNVGVDVVVANELIKERAEVLQSNFSDCKMIVGDINEVFSEIIEETKQALNTQKLDFILATPPCQGMSKNGRGKLLSLIRKGDRPKLDVRNQLIVPTINIVKELMPEIVVFENVPEMKDTLIEYDNKLVNITDFINNKLSSIGYFGTAEVVEFADYGVPQRRQRLITVYSRNKNLVDYFKKNFSFLPRTTHSNNDKRKKPWVTVRDAINKVPKLDAKNKTTSVSKKIPYHRVPLLDKDKYFWVSSTPPEKGAFDNQCVSCGFDKNPTHGSSKDRNGINRANKDTPLYCVNCGELLPRPWVKKGDNYRLMKGYTSSYRRMKWDLPATALTTNLSYACSDSKLHPEQNRVLSLYEAFIIHTIDKYEYKWKRADGKKVSDKLIREIIGESIPPKGLEVILKHIVEIYQSIDTTLPSKEEQMRLFQEPIECYNLSPEL